MNETPKVVLSSTGVDVDHWDNSSVAIGDGASHVKDLKTRPGQAIVLFGGVYQVLERVEPVRPVVLVALQPNAGRLKRGGTQPAPVLAALDRPLDQPGLPEHLHVLRRSGERHRQRLGSAPTVRSSAVSRSSMSRLTS